MDTEADLPTLIRRKDHLNVLRYIRVFELKEPELVVEHGQAWLGPDLKRQQRSANAIVRRTALEQVALAALDLNRPTLASQCLDVLKDVEKIPPDSVRFRQLLARCLEASGDINGADLIYADLTNDKETPSNLSAHRRQYCLQKAQASNSHETTIAAHQALVDHLRQFPTDAAGWYELAQQRKALGDFAAAAYCYEEVLFSSTPLDAALHVELAECWATAAFATTAEGQDKGDKKHASSSSTTTTAERLLLARQHMAQALELDATYTAAQWGLLQCSNLYLQHVQDVKESGTRRQQAAAVDPFQEQVSQALLEHAAAALKETYQGTPLEAAVVQLCRECVEGETGDDE